MLTPLSILSLDQGPKWRPDAAPSLAQSPPAAVRPRPDLLALLRALARIGRPAQ